MEDLQTSILANDNASTPAVARGAHQAQVNQGQHIDITELVQALQRTQIQSRTVFKVPTFDGENDIDLFLLQFHDIRRANHWVDTESLLHLRSALTGKAMECGRGETLEEVLENLVSRFGISTKKARDRLKIMHKSPHESVYELGMEINKMVKIAYPRMDQADRSEMAIDTFSKAMDNRALQRHLLARPPLDISEAISFTEEFLQVGGEHRPSRVTAISDEHNSTETASMTQGIMQTLQAMQETLSQQAEAIKLLHNRTTGTAATERRPVTCYECQGPHFKRNCPQLKGKFPNRAQPSGNANGPTQSETQLGRDLKH